MGNCWARFRRQKKKNKVGPDPQICLKETKDRDVSEVLSLGSASMSNSSLSFHGELKMVEELTISEEESSSINLKSFGIEKDTMDEIKIEDSSQTTKKPVFFQIDFVQGMRSMPPRLASRMEQRKVDQMKLTDEDELLMDEIMEEFEAQEKLNKLRDQLIAAEFLRKEHLQRIREKARGMGSRPPTRAGGHHVGWEKG